MVAHSPTIEQVLVYGQPIAYRVNQNLNLRTTCRQSVTMVVPQDPVHIDTLSSGHLDKDVIAFGDVLRVVFGVGVVGGSGNPMTGRQPHMEMLSRNLKSHHDFSTRVATSRCALLHLHECNTGRGVLAS
jgi:hypothetical protein